MENEKINIGIISNQKAADIANVSKQAIYDLKIKGNWNFFNEKGKVDTSHPDWEKYINRKTKENSAKEIKKQNKEKMIENDEPIIIPKKQINVTIGTKLGEVKPEQKKIIVDREGGKQANALTGGYNPANFIPTEIKDIQSLTKIEEMKIKMEVMLGGLVEREMVVSIIENISQGIQGHFNDLGRRVSSLICMKLDKPGYEKVVEDVINPMVQQGIKDIKKKAKDSIEVKLDEK